MVKETTEAVAPETLSVVEVPHVVLVVISVVIVIAVTNYARQLYRIWL